MPNKNTDETPVPPTPPVPLSALLAREDLALRQIAGPADPATVVHGAHVSEMADPYPYLQGGELLLSAGVHIPEAAGSGTYFDAYVSRIVAGGGVALGFGVAPVHDTVPRALVAACEAYGLPLIEVPERTTFAEVARAVWQLMERARTAELRRVTEAQQSLTAAASRPDPVPSVLRQLSQRLGGRAALFDPEGREVLGTGRVPGAPGADEETVREALGRLAAVVRPGGRGERTPESRSPEDRMPGSPSPENRAPETGSPRPEPSAHRSPTARSRETRSPEASAPRDAAPHATPTPPSTPTSATDTLPATHLTAYALGPTPGYVLATAAPNRSPGDHTITSVAAVLLTLLTGEQRGGTGVARTSALVRLLLGGAPEEVVPLLGAGRWSVVHARRDGAAPDQLAASALGAALGTSLVDVADGVVRLLVPGEAGAVVGWTLGVSAQAGADGLAGADGQAARALARAVATRAPVVRHSARAGLTGLVAADDLRAYAQELLAPLAELPALAETLRTWLSLHGSWDRTAVALGVHRNTVRQRVARCGTLLGTDLDDPDVRMELWFALRHDT